MKNWIRVTLVSSILIGGTVSFGYWSVNQFNQVFDTLSYNLSATSGANVSAVSALLKKDTEVASTSLEVSTNAFATSTPTSEVGAPTKSVGADPEVSFTLLHKNVGLYIGCTYPISWQASTTIRSLETTLVDAAPRDVVDQKISGLEKENTIEDSQPIHWKVGEGVLPGTYYIKISKINGAEAVVRSSAFAINKMPEGLDEKEQTSMCR